MNKELIEVKKNKELKVIKENKKLYILKQFGKIGEYNEYKFILLFLLFGDKGINYLFWSKKKQIKKKVINYKIMEKHLMKTEKNNMLIKCLMERKIRNIIE